MDLDEAERLRDAAERLSDEVAGWLRRRADLAEEEYSRAELVDYADVQRGHWPFLLDWWDLEISRLQSGQGLSDPKEEARRQRWRRAWPPQGRALLNVELVGELLGLHLEAHGLDSEPIERHTAEVLFAQGTRRKWRHAETANAQLNRLRKRSGLAENKEKPVPVWVSLSEVLAALEAGQIEDHPTRRTLELWCKPTRGGGAAKIRAKKEGGRWHMELHDLIDKHNGWIRALTDHFGGRRGIDSPAKPTSDDGRS